MSLPFIMALEGPTLLDQEKEFITEYQPWGIIHFARNIVEAKQIHELNRELRTHGIKHILVDQEGGRVQRLRAPEFTDYPAVQTYGDIARFDMANARSLVWNHYQQLGKELSLLGFDINCAPVLDVQSTYTHDVIGNRSFSSDPWVVAELSSVACEAMRSCGIHPVIKHIPGHGRARHDSHVQLPEVTDDKSILFAHDFIPFREMRHEQYAMTAHVTFFALDTEPVTHSAKLISYIRQQLGFRGLLMTDDLAMNALQGNLTERAEFAVRAGCDLLLFCEADLGRCTDVADVARNLMCHGH